MEWIFFPLDSRLLRLEKDSLSGGKAKQLFLKTGLRFSPPLREHSAVQCADKVKSRTEGHMWEVSSSRCRVTIWF